MVIEIIVILIIFIGIICCGEWVAINTKTTAARIAVSPSPPMEEVRLLKLFATDLGNDPAPPPIRRKATKPAIATSKANSVIFHMNLLICPMHSVRSFSLLSI